MKNKSGGKTDTKEAPSDQLASKKVDDFQKLVIEKNDYYDEVSTDDDFLENLMEFKRKEPTKKE